MPILTKTVPFVSACILIFHLPAFAWSNNSSFSNTRVASIGSTKAISAISSTETSSSRSWGSPASYSSSSEFSSLPASFQSVISKFDISQSVVPSEATIQQGLTEALAINNNYLEGNEYKAAMIQPIMNLLLSGDYSASTKELALSNLYSIATNERIDYSQKSEMAGELIEYMERTVTGTINGTSDAESAGNDIKRTDAILVKLIRDSGISIEEQKDILIAITNNKIIYKSSPIRTITAGVMTDIYRALISDKDYPLTWIDDSNTDRGKLSLAHLLEKTAINYNNVFLSTGTMWALNTLLDDTTLSSEEVNTILVTTQYILENQSEQDYSLETACLSTLMKLSGDTRLNEESRIKIQELITSYGLNTYNRSLYQDNQVLLLAEDTSLYGSKAVAILTGVIESVPDKSPAIISLQQEVISSLESENIDNNLEASGLYDSDSDIVEIKVKDSNSNYAYSTTVIHEFTHYIEDNLMTTEQKSELNNIWLEADDALDFVREYGQTSRSDYLATTAEAVWTERNSGSKPVLERAQQQATNGDPALLKMYNLAQEIWGLS